MSGASVIFTFEGINVKIQCSTNDKMKDICQKYANKIERNVNSLVFLYGGSNLNFQLSFKEQANIIDRERNEMSILVYKNENDLTCTKCGEKINLNTEKINDIRTSIKNIGDTVRGIKIMIDNIIKISLVDIVNIQLKNVNIIFNNLNEDIKKLNEKFNDLFNVNNINKKLNLDNYIIAKIKIKDEDINKNIKILSSYEEYIRDNPGKLTENDIYKDEDEIKQCKININDEIIPFSYYYKFKSKGEYTIKYSFKNNLKSLCLIYGGCELITKIDLSHFNTKDIIYMTSMFYGCLSLTDLSNFNTNYVTNMISMFSGCSSLKNIDLSNFNTNNVTNMGFMFYGCSSLKNINLSNFNTNNVTNMSYMFYGCSSLININLSSFNTNNVTNMGCMFYGCSSLKNIDLSNFNTNNVTNMIGMFGVCSSLNKNNIIIKDKSIFNNKDIFQKF